MLGKVRFDVTVRQLLRDMLIMVGLLRIEGVDPTHEQAPLLIAVCVLYGLHFACQASRSWCAAPARCRSSPATSTPRRCG